MTPEQYLRELQASPKTVRGFNSDLNAWVDEGSSIARLLMDLQDQGLVLV